MEKQYYENGSPKEFSTLTIDGRLTGTFQTWYPNGKKKIQAQYREGGLQGIYKEWYENGQLAKFHTYNKGKQEGYNVEYTEDGKEISVAHLPPIILPSEEELPKQDKELLKEIASMTMFTGSSSYSKDILKEQYLKAKDRK